MLVFQGVSLLCLFLLVDRAFSNYNLTIVHIGDFHSHWFEFNENEERCSLEESEAGKCYGGFPRLVSLVRDIRSKEKNVIVLSSGEFFLGRSLNSLHGWKIATSLLPRIDIDAMSLSNHDFDSGVFELSAFLYAMKFPVLCANMWARETSFLYNRINKSSVLDVNGERIGVVGYVHPDTLLKSRKAASVKFFPEIPYIQQEVKRLEENGINKIVALGHSGYHTDVEIANNVTGIDVVIGGNSDIVLEEPDDENSETSTHGNIHGNYPRVHYHAVDEETLVGSEKQNRTLILHIPQHGKYVGIIRLTFDVDGRVIRESGEPVLLDSSIPQDQESLAYIQNASLALEQITRNERLPDSSDVLAVAEEDFESRNCRMGECSLGNFVTDAIFDSYQEKEDSVWDDGEAEMKWHVDAVVFNSGSIRHILPKGNVTLKSLVHSLFLGDFMTRWRLSGKDILRMMEHSVQSYDPTGVATSGAFLQISGLRVIFEIDKPPGSRVAKLDIRCKHCEDDYEPISRSKMYYVAMPGFIAGGGDGFVEYEDKDNDYGVSEIMLILEFLEKVRKIKPILDGRIHVINSYINRWSKASTSTKPVSSNTTSDVPPLFATRPVGLSGEDSNLLEKNYSNPSVILSVHEAQQLAEQATSHLFLLTRKISTTETIETSSSDVRTEHPQIYSSENAESHQARALERKSKLLPGGIHGFEEQNGFSEIHSRNDAKGFPNTDRIGESELDIYEGAETTKTTNFDTFKISSSVADIERSENTHTKTFNESVSDPNRKPKLESLFDYRNYFEKFVAIEPRNGVSNITLGNLESKETERYLISSNERKELDNHMASVNKLMKTFEVQEGRSDVPPAIKEANSDIAKKEVSFRPTFANISKTIMHASTIHPLAEESEKITESYAGEEAENKYVSQLMNMFPVTFQKTLFEAVTAISRDKDYSKMQNVLEDIGNVLIQGLEGILEDRMNKSTTISPHTSLPTVEIKVDNHNIEDILNYMQLPAQGANHPEAPREESSSSFLTEKSLLGILKLERNANDGKDFENNQDPAALSLDESSHGKLENSKHISDAVKFAIRNVENIWMVPAAIAVLEKVESMRKIELETNAPVEFYQSSLESAMNTINSVASSSSADTDDTSSPPKTDDILEQGSQSRFEILHHPKGQFADINEAKANTRSGEEIEDSTVNGDPTSTTNIDDIEEDIHFPLQNSFDIAKEEAVKVNKAKTDGGSTEIDASMEIPPESEEGSDHELDPEDTWFSFLLD